MKQTNLSIIIVNFNTRELLDNCLESIQTYCPNAQVIVVDNGSQDGSPEMVAEQYSAVDLVAVDENLGFAPANNLGMDRAIGDFVVLLNSDTILVDDTLERAVAWMRENPDVGAASPRLIDSDGYPQQCLYHFPTLSAYLKEAVRIDPWKASDVTNGWLAGTALILRKEALEQIGGKLDGTHFMYWEDADMGARLVQAGWKTAVFEDGHIIHFGGASGGGADATRRADLHKWYVFGKHRWFRKHRPWWERIALWWLDGFNVLRQLIRSGVRQDRRGEWNHAWATVDVLRRLVLGQTPPLPGK